MSKEIKAALAAAVLITVGLLPFIAKICSQHDQIQRLKKEYALLDEQDKWNRKRLWDRSVSLDKMRHDLHYANACITRWETGKILEKTSFELVKEFHVAFGHPVSKEAGMIPKSREELRVKLIDEEFTELKEAIEARDIVAIADALTDLNYVVYGAALEWGVPADECFRVVHKSNMSKLGEDGKPIYLDNGKVAKGPNYLPPDLKPLLGVDQ